MAPAQGVVTHCTDVKPLIAVATYLDVTSGIEVFQEVHGPMFTPIDKGAKHVNPQGEPLLQMRGSKLVKFQQIKLQEMSDEVPTSATPRCAPARTMWRLAQHHVPRAPRFVTLSCRRS